MTGSGVYNERRPHESLGGLPSSVYREKVTAKKFYLRTFYLNRKLTIELCRTIRRRILVLFAMKGYLRKQTPKRIEFDHFSSLL